ncbi:MAG: hypothetical protein KDI55_00150 [Anaerolineae bacterium]|nr:hypothetical protein [Anaerolineae bacterium]
MGDRKPFLDLISDMEDGRLVVHLTKLYHDIVAATMDVRKEGKLTLEFTFSVSGRGVVEIDTSIKAKIPEHARPSTTFFFDENGNTLRRDDPKQPKFEFNERRDDTETYSRRDD